METENILREKSNFGNQMSIKASDPVKDHAEMDHHQNIYEKENFNPKSLKEIAAGSQTDLNNTGTIENANDTFTHETEALKPTNTTFDQLSDDDESYISTNESLSFLTDGFNNIKLDGEGRRSSGPVNSTMHRETDINQHVAEPAVNTTLTMESPISECSQKTNTTFTGDKTQEFIQSPVVENKTEEFIQSPLVENKTEEFIQSPIIEDKTGEHVTGEGFPETVCEYNPKVDTIDEVAAMAEDLNPEILVTPISPILPHTDEPSTDYVSANSQNIHENNITSSATFENTQGNSEVLPVTEVKFNLTPEEKFESLESLHDQQSSENVEKQIDISSPNVIHEEKSQDAQKSLIAQEIMPEQSLDTIKANESTAIEITQDISMPFKNLDDNLEKATAKTSQDHKLNITVPINTKINNEGNLPTPIPMEVDQTFSDDVISDDPPQETVKDVEEVQKAPEKPQKVFECEFVSQSVQELQFDFKTPETSQQAKPDNLEETLEMQSPPNTEMHNSSEAEKSQEEFKIPQMPKRLSVEKFESGASYNFGNFDLDVLQKFGSNTPADYSVGRDSVLLKFDPLLEKLTPVENNTNQRLTPTANATTIRLESTKEEDEHYTEVQSLDHKLDNLISIESTNCISTTPQTSPPPPLQPSNAETSAMKDLDQGNETIESVHETKEQFKDLSIGDNNTQQLLQQQEIEFNKKMTELESQLRKEAEMKEEALLKRITEKEKQMAKMNNVVEAYEKAIAELIAEKEQLTQGYEKKCLELKSDSEQNLHHLGSLESTFSDLHAKYERTKQMAAELKDREEAILQDRKALQESLKLQETRYEKMKMHAMSQLEIANNKLAEMQRNHQAEITKLKAQLKKEEISRASINEQLIQKSKENAELVKICDELIGNHGHTQNA